MDPVQFVEALSKLKFKNSFNPYSNRCVVHDLDDAPQRRLHALLTVLEAATKQDVDSIWIGRDLGYRGGRRTGLALTDDVHVHEYAARWGLSIQRPTKGDVAAERTAAVIWSVLSQIEVSVFLWNVFPLHPHEPGNPFSNRSHNSLERRTGEEFLSQLIFLLKPRRLVAIGNDAARTVHRLRYQHRVVQVRHPSYGGQTQFLAQMYELYNLQSDLSQTPQHSVQLTIPRILRRGT